MTSIKPMNPVYFIVTSGNSMAGERDFYRRCTEEEYQVHVDPTGWTRAVRMWVADE